MIWGLDITESRHSGEADSILNNPKQLLVGVALHLFAREIGCARVHPLPREFVVIGHRRHDICCNRVRSVNRLFQCLLWCPGGAEEFRAG